MQTSHWYYMYIGKIQLKVYVCVVVDIQITDCFKRFR